MSHTIELTREEAQTAWNAMEYAFEALDSDMSLSEEDRAEVRKLEELKDRIKEQLDAEDANRESYREAFDSMMGRPMKEMSF